MSRGVEVEYADGTAGASGGSSTVHRAIALLEALADAPPEGLGISELSTRIGANRSTVYRILGVLRPSGYVRDGSQAGTVRLGFRIVELGERVLGQLDVRRIAAPHIRKLAIATGETCHLAALDGNHVVYTDKAESPQSIRLHSTLGMRMPIHCTSLGKAFLAAMTTESRSRLLDSVSFTRKTDHTITDRMELERELGVIRARGWAADLGENEAGTRCVGAAIVGRGNLPVAAVSASGPAARMSDARISECGALVWQTAQAISQELGHLS
jgi:IclR family acetate operon transcriptional repressor